MTELLIVGEVALFTVSIFGIVAMAPVSIPTFLASVGLCTSFMFALKTDAPGPINPDKVEQVAEETLD